MPRLDCARSNCYLLLSVGVLCAAGVFASEQKRVRPAHTRSTTWRHVVVEGVREWTDSHVAIEQGDTLVTNAEGRGSSGSGSGACRPKGKTRTWEDLLLAYPVNTAGAGALIGRIGPEPAVPFVIGEHLKVTVSQSGELFLGLNMLDGEHSSCTLNVAVRVVPHRSSPDGVVKPTTRIPVALLGRIPRRVVDGSGRLGDPVNFVLVGSEEQVLSAFQRAGWLPVDRTPEEAAIHVLLASIGKQAYTEMPMSELYLFGRVQDYGFARAKPVEVITARHHLRIWRTTFRLGSQPIWAGAATHDIGLEPDQRNGSITHKIDPDVDKERDFLRATLMAGGGVQSSDLQLPALAIREGLTATGGTFQSDGRILEVILGD
jgi:hypothetical protein